MAEEPVSVELLTSKQLAARLQIDIKTLHALRKAEVIKAIIITPKIFRWDPVEVLKKITENSDRGDVKAARAHPD